jgi:hypothetical protein
MKQQYAEVDFVTTVMTARASEELEKAIAQELEDNAKEKEDKVPQEHD